MKMLWFQEHTLENIVRKILVACYHKNQARDFAKLQHSGLLFLYFNDFNKTMLDKKKDFEKVIWVLLLIADYTWSQYMLKIKGFDQYTLLYC